MDTIERMTLDQEWILLVQAAKDLGLTQEEVTQFLKTTMKESEN
ncbi:anti-repressor SinI family protein [Cytobacillus sp. FJAT-54145]|uniref:Anti-repressor SinI family protein n=1 Tax=Cytobacillus spartinae TaxID=3299023 RepID=A0ABW6KD65_9BACI